MNNSTPVPAGLFPEPARVEQPDDDLRWHVIDDRDGPTFAETHAARVLGAFPTFDAVRGHYDGSDWLYDTLTDQLYAPYTWPDTDEPRAISLHLRALSGVDA